MCEVHSVDISVIEICADILGSPCNNFQGYCDVFSRCRGVDNDGPLQRLKNLIFNEKTLENIKNWIIVSLFNKKNLIFNEKSLEDLSKFIP